MKKVTKILSSVIILALLISMTACSGGGNTVSKIALKNVWDNYLKENNESELYFLPSDYDGDGSEEAYGITGKNDGVGYTYNVKIYFINSAGNVSCVKDSAYGGGSLFGQLQNYEKLTADSEKVFLKAGKQKFIVWEIDGGGSSSVSVVLGVRNDAPYQPKISGKYQYFHRSNDDGNVYIGTTSDWSQGYHDYTDVSFSFNASTGEFEEKK